ncbi:hypothetical protein HPP92_019902 [Vanilla planifolia]|uniref:Uncharacterized protein n=1 Tax=Vanilla planifolia TaxID=51239 RepID=A0A835Q7D4_VANPL|nr:hypothetical protein HPP92_019902 [Vanilla planifolia]
MKDSQPRLVEDGFHHPSTSAVIGGAGGNMDRVLFQNLVEMVPLVESLMDKRASSSFTRRASIVHTPAPPHLKKAADHKRKKAVQCSSLKTQKDAEECVEDEKNELLLLQNQVADLQKRLSEKEEALKSAENLTIQVNATHASLGELRRQVSERDALIKSTNTELYDAKIKLADKQAALEKLEWEAKLSKQKLQELQGEAISNEQTISALMQLFGELAKGYSYSCMDDQTTCYELLPPLDDMDDIDMAKMEEARIAYLAAVAAAKEETTDETLAAVAEARRKLQTFVL